MNHSIGNFRLEPTDIQLEDLYGFMLNEFYDNSPKDNKYYYTTLDCLIDTVVKCGK